MAAAATAIPGGVLTATESGNLVTLTFAATTAPPLGQAVTIAGFTGANTGYNGFFTVLTSTTTQIQYFDNTTGLATLGAGGTADAVPGGMA